VQGTSTTDLQQGPGHYPGTPLPGEQGNAAIAGHRTTYGAPFYNLDELAPGDPIVITTVQGTFTYRVTKTVIVTPSDTSVVDNTTTPELTLTTCNPRYSATQRLVVVATLRSSHMNEVLRAVAPTAPAQKATRSGDATLADNGGGGSVGGAVLWGMLTAGAALGLWVLWRRVRTPGRWGVLTLGSPVVLIVLFIFFGHVSAVLPASF